MCKTKKRIRWLPSADSADSADVRSSAAAVIPPKKSYGWRGRGGRGSPAGPASGHGQRAEDHRDDHGRGG